jgi:isopentenyl phosphate kinase
LVTIVKLGGSVLTDKTRLFSFQEATARRLAAEIRQADTIPVIVYGTGTFGKAYARHYSRPARTTADWRIFQLTTMAIRQLGENLSQVLHDEGVPHCLIPANALFYRREGRLSWDGPGPLTRLLGCGIVPVLCGDVLAEERACFRIIGSDDIIPLLAEGMPVGSCVFVTDVDGVLDESGRLISDIGAGPALLASLGGQDDITGAMDAKVVAARLAAQNGAASVIVNGLVPGRLRAALRGDEIVGTRVAGPAPAASVPGGSQPGIPAAVAP